MNISSILHKKKLLSETIDIESLKFPPLAYGAFGKYFIGPDGEIQYQIISQQGNQNGVAHVNNFLPIYQKFFLPHINSEMVKQFKEKYLKNMSWDKDEIKETKLSFPEIFNSPSAKWVADDEGVTYRIKTAQGEQQGICSIEEFEAYYQQNMASFGSNQAAAMHPNESNKEAMARRLGLSDVK
jgi:hypothetical protein